MSRSDKESILDAAIARINKQFGAGSVVQAGDINTDVKTVSTGALTLDLALGVGGIPYGRITEIYGPESSGKTTLALTIARGVQLHGGRVAIVDVEHALDLLYAERLGVHTGELLVSQPDTAESALEICEILVRAGIECVILDSVALLIPEAEIKGEMTDQQMGLQARIMGKALRKLTAPVSENGTAMIFLNQIRSNIGYGAAEITPGGKALRFSASVRIALKKGDQVKIGERVNGQEINSVVVKNKLAAPAKTAKFTIYFDRGIDYNDSLFIAAEARSVLARRGTWVYWGDQQIGQGKERAIEWLEKTPGAMDKLRKEVLA